MPRIIPNLWFDDQALEAVEYYVSVFPNSKITAVSHYTEAGPREAGPRETGPRETGPLQTGMVLTVDFELDGQPFTAINGGPQFTFDEAISLLIECADQDEVDHYWDTFTKEGEESQCGWLKDRYGVSWQVVPTGMAELMTDADPARANRAMQAMLGMRKIDLAALRAAADGE